MPNDPPVSTVNCPTCGKTVVYTPAEPFRPFCSERCRLIDLGEWATGSYAIPCEDPAAPGPNEDAGFGVQ